MRHPLLRPAARHQVRQREGGRRHTTEGSALVSDQPKHVFDRTQGPTEVRAAVQTQVTENDRDPWEAIEEAEGPLAVGRMRLMGVYDDRQRNRFMLRIRIPGGQINADQLDTVAGVIRRRRRPAWLSPGHATDRGVPDLLEERGEADGVPAAQVEGRRDRLPD